MRWIRVVKYNTFTFLALLIAAAVSGITCIYSVVLGVAEVAVVIAAAVAAYRWHAADLARKREQVRILSASLLTGTDLSDELRRFPLPVLLTDADGAFIWFNSRFEELLPDFSELEESNLNGLYPFSKKVAEKEEPAPFELRGAKRAYTVYPAALGDGRYALYFVDDTSLKEIRAKFKSTRPVVILINTDSLEQAEDVMPHEDYYVLNAAIDRVITKWFVEYNCVFRKISDGRFFALTESENLKRMIETRFDIIDKVRSGHFGPDDLEITLSIGVGHTKDLKTCEDEAREALDMARGRGGDQVAVKNGDSYEFFGGISSGREKRGKVKARTFAAALDEYIDRASDVLIMGHAFSDFDCVGASAGLVAIVRAKSKNAHVVIDKKRSMAMPMVRMLETGSGAISFISPERAEEIAGPDTLLIVADTMRSKLVEAPGLLNRGMRIAVIDHHRMAVDHIEGNTFEFLEPHASSACEMVTELVQYSRSKPKLTPVLAQALLAGIMLDTKDFTLRVGVRTFDAASYLRSCKADTVAVRKLFAGTAEENIRVNNIVNAAVYYDRYAIAVSDVSGPNARLICSKAADELLSIERVDASFVVSAYGGAVNISARSLGRVNVQLIMEQLGGGGHHSMAAAQLQDTDVNTALDLLKEKIDAYFNQTNERSPA